MHGNRKYIIDDTEDDDSSDHWVLFEMCYMLTLFILITTQQVNAVIALFYRRGNIITRNKVTAKNDRDSLEDPGFKPGILALKSNFQTNGFEKLHGIQSTDRTRYCYGS